MGHYVEILVDGAGLKVKRYHAFVILLPAIKGH